MPLALQPAMAASSVTVKTVVRADAKSGHLVRKVVALETARPIPAQLNEMVARIAGREGVEAPLVQSVIKAESNYNAAAVSPKGAQGIMQLIPSTAQRFGVQNAFDPEENIQGGVKYLRFLLDYYNGDYTKSIAAYNAGEAAVDKFHGVPPYAETLGYVRAVAKQLTTERRNEAERSVASPSKAAKLDESQPITLADQPRHIQAHAGPDGLIYYKTPE